MRRVADWCIYNILFFDFLGPDESRLVEKNFMDDKVVKH